MKTLKTISIRLLVISMLLFGAFYFVLNTQPGLQLSAKVLTHVLPGKLQYANLSGSITKEINVSDFIYDDGATKIAIKSFHLQWDLHDFFDKVTINHLSAQDVTVTTTPSKNKDKTNFKRLAYFDIQQAEVKNLTVNQTHIPRIAIQKDSAGLDNVLIESNMGKITGHYRLQFTPVLQWDAQLEVAGINPAVLSPDLQGKLDISVTTQGEWSHHKDEVNVQLDKFNGELGSYPVTGSAKLHYLNGELVIQTAQLKLADLVSNISGSVKDNWDVKWQINIPALKALFPNAQGSLVSTGNLTGAKLSPNIHAVVKLGDLTDIKDVHANVDGKVDITLNKGNFSYATNLKLTNMALVAPKLGLNIQPMTVTIANKLDEPIHLSGDFSSGDGKGNVSGTLDLNDDAQDLQLKLTGTNLQILNLKEYKVTASPNLNLTYKDNQLSASGTIDIPTAQITPTNFNDVVTLPSEVVFISDDKNTKDMADLPPNLALDIQLNLGDHIHIDYDNLTADLKGNLKIKQTPGSLPIATGELSTNNAKYKAYGKQMDVQTGRLIYTGNALNNPGLDINASKQVSAAASSDSSQFSNDPNIQASNGEVYKIHNSYYGTINVGVSVKGNLDKPVINFYSDANLSQEDIISYLVFGYPRSQITSVSGVTLLNSLAMNSKAGKASIGDAPAKIQKTLGLNEFGVGSAETYNKATDSLNNTTTFNLGKQIGDKLFLHYSVGIFNSYQTLNLRYQITKHLSVQSETSTLENGADVFYQFER